MMGSLTNIDQDGFPSMTFHAFPDSLRWDPISGDYGLNFFGHAENSATYLVNDPELGWQAFGGNVRVSGNVVSLTPLDSLCRRIYIAPAGLWLNLDAGQFQTVTFDTQTHVVQLTLAPADSYTPSAHLRIEQPLAAKPLGTYTPTTTVTRERDAYVVPLDTAPKAFELAASPH